MSTRGAHNVKVWSGHQRTGARVGGSRAPVHLHHERIPGGPATHHAGKWRRDANVVRVRQVTPPADIGVIGGSGFYSLLDDASPVGLDTPFGPPSGDVTVGTLGGRRVAFVPRHGVGHRFAPHRVPHRANLWALRSAGVRQILALSAVGSLRTDLPPGSLVIPDQILDRTSGRAHTYMDAENGVFHVAFADPYCPVGRACALAAAGVTGLPVTAEATMVVVNGPRFSTRAESAGVPAGRSRDHRHDRHARGRARPGARPVLHDADPGDRPGRRH